MLKVKVFDVGIGDLENAINEWLTKAGIAKIQDIRFSGIGNSNVDYHAFVLIFYDDGRSKLR